jgi:hypothetical protein
MKASSSCSCRLGLVVRALGLRSRPFPNKRRWQFVAATILFFIALFFYVAITGNVDHHGLVALAVFSFLGMAIFFAALLTAMVGSVGCDDCVSRM